MAEVEADASLTLTMDAKDNASNAVDAVRTSLESVSTTTAAVGNAAQTMGATSEAGMNQAAESGETLGSRWHNALGAASEALEGVRTAVGTFGLAAAGVFAESGESFVRYGASIEKIAFMTGTTTQAASGLVSGFEGAGLSAEQAQGMVQRLEMRLGNLDQQMKTATGASLQHNALHQLGISLHDAHGAAIPMTEVIPQIIDKLKGIEDPTERARIATQLFGRNWASLAPMIEQGGAAFTAAMGDAKRFGIALSQDQVDAAHNAEVAHQRLKEALQGVTLQFGEALVPLETAASNALIGLAAAYTRLSPAIHQTILHLMELAAIFGPVIGGAEAVAGIGEHLAAVFPFLGAHIRGFGEVLERIQGAIGGIVGRIPLLGSIAEPFMAVLGPIGGAVTLLLTLRSAYEHIGIVHLALAPLVHALGTAFGVLRDIFSVVVHDFARGGDFFVNFETALDDVGRKLGINGGAMNGFVNMLDNLQGMLHRVIAPILIWNDALLHGKEPLEATKAMFGTLSAELEGVAPPLHQITLAIADGIQVFQRFHDVGLALSVVWQNMGGSVEQGVVIWHTFDNVAKAIGTLGTTFTSFVQVLQHTHDLGLAMSVAWQNLGGSVEQGVVIWRTFDGVVKTIGTTVTSFVQVLMHTHDLGLAVAVAIENMGGSAQVAIGVWHGMNAAATLVRAVLQELGTAFHQIAAAALPAIQHAMTQIGPAFASLSPAIGQIRTAMVAMEPVVQAIAVVLGALGAVILVLLGGVFQGLVAGLSVAIPVAINFAVGVFKVLIDLVGIVVTVVTGLVTIVSNLMTGNWAGAWNAAKTMVASFVPEVIHLIGDLVGTVAGLFTGMGNTVQAILEGFVKGVIGAAMNLYNALVGHSIIPDLINGIINWFASLPGAVVGILQGAVVSMATAAANMGQAAYNGLTSALGGIAGAVGGILSGVTGVVWGLIGAFASAGAAVGNAIYGGITGALSNIGWAIRNAVSQAKNVLPGPIQDALGALGLAEGGIVGPGFGGPRLAYVGEGRSAEAVTPLDRLPSIMAAAMREAGGGGGGPITLVVNLDGREVARSVFNHGADRWKLMGGNTGSNA